MIEVEDICENCQLPVPQGEEYTWGKDCYCGFPSEIVNLCAKVAEKENRVPVLHLDHIKQFREHGTFPKELAYTANTETDDDDDSINGITNDLTKENKPIIRTPHPTKRGGSVTQGAPEDAEYVEMDQFMTNEIGAVGGTTYNPASNPITSTGIGGKPPPFDPSGVLSQHPTSQDHASAPTDGTLNDPKILMPKTGEAKAAETKTRSHQMMTRRQAKLLIPDKLTENEQSQRAAGLARDNLEQLARSLQDNDDLINQLGDSAQSTQAASEEVENSIVGMFKYARDDLKSTHGQLIKTYQNVKSKTKNI